VKSPDARRAFQLIAVRSPIASRVVLARRSGLDGPADAVLEDRGRSRNSQDVPPTLVFRHAWEATIEAPVSAPGTP
jgi:hypothetical protein